MFTWFIDKSIYLLSCAFAHRPNTWHKLDSVQKKRFKKKPNPAVFWGLSSDGFFGFSHRQMGRNK